LINNIENEFIDSVDIDNEINESQKISKETIEKIIKDIFKDKLISFEELKKDSNSNYYTIRIGESEDKSIFHTLHVKHNKKIDFSIFRLSLPYRISKSRIVDSFYEKINEFNSVCPAKVLTIEYEDSVRIIIEFTAYIYNNAPYKNIKSIIAASFMNVDNPKINIAEVTK